MKFRNRPNEEPEINLIPFIDVLLVIIIFLMLTTTYSQVSALQVRLPDSSSQAQEVPNHKIDVVVTADGTYAINGFIVNNPSVARLSQVLIQAVTDPQEALLIISADGDATHQSVVKIMDAAKQAGLTRLTFATRTVPES